MQPEILKTVAVIVAHPDDETLWAGGTMLTNLTWNWNVVCLSRKSDTERSIKFKKAVQILGARGFMGDLNDGPEQHPLVESEIETAILALLPSRSFDLLVTHSLLGEYTRHLRHEEVGKAVTRLWVNGVIETKEMWQFAYEDGNKAYFPKAIRNATVCNRLKAAIWERKYDLIVGTYGFEQNSWEAMTTPREEAFWKIKDKLDAASMLLDFESRNSSAWIGNRIPSPIQK